MLKLLPGMGNTGDMDIDDGEIGKMEGIVHSMTTDERRDPDIIGSSRRRRIAKGCGRDGQEVASLIKTFKRSREMMKNMSAGGMGGLKGMLSGKTDMMSALSGGARKVKQRSKRKRVIKRRGKVRRR